VTTHAKADRELLVAEHDHGAEQEHDDRRNLGGQALAGLARSRGDAIAGHDEGTHDHERGSEDPGNRKGSRQPTRGRSEKRQQNKGAQARNVAGFLLLGLALLALDADESAQQDGGSEIERDCQKLSIFHGQAARFLTCSG